ncbi:probable tRNA wybutosine-synthesizing protein 5 at C-terminar half [Coccomyxa sp. Obi]|nr:probable tRNA wybutosine-synthesizing protein 5 at C-terminar half [Coccomyxa sp. Obi]
MPESISSSSNSGFNQRRSHVLALLEQNARDKSRAGGVDAPIADLVATLNSWPRIFTTSSCSGRVSVFAEPTAATRAAGHKGGEWVFVTHGLADADALLAAVQSRCSNGAPLVFRFEPFILAAEAQSAADAQCLIRCARDAGYRESGVTGDESSRVIAGIRCSIRLEVPVTDGQRLLVSHDYLRHLVKLANQKMEANWERIERFHALFRQQFLSDHAPGTVNGGQRGARGGSAVECEQTGCAPKPAQRSGASGKEKGVAAKSGGSVQKLQALHARQCGILQRLQQLEGSRAGICAFDSSSSAIWRPAPLHAHGVPSETLRLWGHSMVSLGGKLVIFGGYGGAGAHRRLGDVLIYDCPSGILRKLQVAGPGPRMGHVAAILSSTMLVHGGRTAPDQALGDLWLLDLTPSKHTSSSHKRPMSEEGAQWMQVDAKGTPPPPRHRHSAVSVGGSLKSGRIIIFGGMGSGVVLGDVWELRLRGKRWHWTQLACIGGQDHVPGPRHSHAAAVVGSNMYVYGGVRDCGQAITGDLHALDLGCQIWRRIITTDSSPRPPPPLFSHTLTALGRDRLVLIGGCPEQDTGDVYIFHLHSQSWRFVRAAAAGGVRPVPIRHCTAAVTAGDSAASQGDTLILIGGGALCFSFGSTFSPPCALHLPRSSRAASPCLEASGSRCAKTATTDSSMPGASQVEGHAIVSHEPISCTSSASSAVASSGMEANGIHAPGNQHNGGADCQPSKVGIEGRTAAGQHCESSSSSQGPLESACNIPTNESQGQGSRVQEAPSSNGGTHDVARPHSGSFKESWALVVPKLEAKIFKDALKDARGLDRRFYSLVCRSGASIALPMTEACVNIVFCQMGRATDGRKRINGEWMTEAQLLLRCGDQGLASICPKQERATQFVADAVAAGSALMYPMKLAEAKLAQSPRDALMEATRDLLSAAGVSDAQAQQLMAEVPSKWERLGDLVLLPADSFRAAEWAAQGDALWTAVGAALKADGLARQAPVANTGTRDSQVQLLKGDDGWVRHLEGGVVYSLDVTRCMFSSGNVTERTRMGKLRASGETVVDLFAGIGYYTLPLLVHAGAAKVVACEWNPSAADALRRNLDMNRCAGYCEVLQGDCRQLAPKGVADRVILGLLPSSSCGWRTALKALRPLKGGWLHLHHNVKDSEEAAWIADTQAELQRLSREMGRFWRVLIRHVERVKWYAPHIRHVVLDVECRPDEAMMFEPDQAVIQVPEQASRLAPDQASSPTPSSAPEQATSLAPHHATSSAPEQAVSPAADQATGPVPNQVASPASDQATRLVPDQASSQGNSCGTVAEHIAKTREEFEKCISAKKKPLVLKGVDLGPAVTRWSGDYLKSLPCSSTTLVSVHVCPDPAGRMDFVHKNFEFRTMPLAELVGRCESPEAFPPLISPGERYYLRSIGVNPRKEPSDIAAAFPELAADLCLPQLFPPDQLFSSVLRISSEGLRLWTHFDVMDNLLCQIRGTKLVRLWPPLEESKLYMTGSSSEVTDIDDPDPVKYPLFVRATHFDCILHPGDVLYIPALWHHNVLTEEGSGFSVSVNVFWRDMDKCMYAGKDLYGNRDPPVAEAAAATVEAATKALAQLPPHYRSFYGQRCVRRLAESCGNVGQ